MKTRKTPMRMCVGCREMRPKRDLIRVVKSKEGHVAVDQTGKMPGRGVYICKDAQCFQKAQKTRQLERALEQKIEPVIFEALENALKTDA